MFAALAASLVAALIILGNLDRTPAGLVLVVGKIARPVSDTGRLALFVIIMLSALGLGMVAPVLWWV